MLDKKAVSSGVLTRPTNGLRSGMRPNKLILISLPILNLDKMMTSTQCHSQHCTSRGDFWPCLAIAQIETDHSARLLLF
jgi:hypothetical protein